MDGTSAKKNSDRVLITNRYKARSVSENDVVYLALQMTCPKRQPVNYTPSLKNIGKHTNMHCIAVETKGFSSLIFLHSSGGANVTGFCELLCKKMISILKSALEKVYFVEHFEINSSPIPVAAFLSAMANVTFLVNHEYKEVCLGYFELQKQDDNLRFMPIAMDMIFSDEPTNYDLYLLLKRNNRYIKYVPKGSVLPLKNKNRLIKKGVLALYMQTDQPINVQIQKAMDFVNLRIKDFYRME